MKNRDMEGQSGHGGETYPLLRRGLFAVAAVGMVWAAAAQPVSGQCGMGPSGTWSRHPADPSVIPGVGLNGWIWGMQALSEGRLLINGKFTFANGASSDQNVALWDGSSWQPLAGGVAAPYAVRGFTELTGGDLIAVPTGGGINTTVQRFDGAAWTSVGVPFARCVLALPGNQYVLGGSFIQSTPQGSASRIALWDGFGWQPMGAGLPASVEDLELLQDGSVAAVSDDKVWLWDGSLWTSLGDLPQLSGAPVPSRAARIKQMPSGLLVAKGDGRLFRWTGSSWVPIWQPPSVSVGYAAIPGSDGEVLCLGVAASEFRFDRWRLGAGWSSEPTPNATFVQPANNVGHAMAALTDGVVVVGGFATPGMPDAILSQYRATCPATATAIGAGCASSIGSLDYEVTSLPWLRSEYRARCSSIAPNSLVARVSSLEPAIQLPLPASLLPSSPLCALYAQPDLVSVQVVASGTMETSLFLPNVSALLGVTFVDQLVAFEFAPGGVWTQTASSNALALSIGNL
ncbi:MAG: hypothetical protein AB8H80_10705 [Planctomycetota bacterium]